MGGIGKAGRIGVGKMKNPKNLRNSKRFSKNCGEKSINQSIPT
jgi:hypothetical protein